MKDKLETLIDYHSSIHPSLTIQDVYKLLYQGTMGPAHLMIDKDKAYIKLKREFKMADKGILEREVLLEPVSINGDMVRVNLRPYRRKSYDIELLFEIVLKSAKNFAPDEDKLNFLWKTFKQLVSKGKLDFNAVKVNAFEVNALSSNGLPIKHSDDYRAKEKPRYRVVKRSIFEALITPSIL